MSRFKSDLMVNGKPERECVEDYCGVFVTSKNKMHAYRVAYRPDREKTTAWIWEQVKKLEADPEVQRRVQEMRDEVAQKEIVTVQEILRHTYDIATADANELISVTLDCCRYCHGFGHQYQWINPQEFEQELAKAVEGQARYDEGERGKGVRRPELPSDAGGYDYWPDNAPHPTCPKCFGRGVNGWIVHDTRRLSDQARRLYAGAEIDMKEGKVKIKMHDQLKAIELAGKVMGAFKDGIPVMPAAPAPTLEKGATPAERQEAAADSYMRLIAGAGPKRA